MGMTLLKQFDNLYQPSGNDNFQFSAKPIENFQNQRIAKDRFGNPTLMITISNPLIKVFNANLKLENVSVLFDVNCKIKQNGKVLQQDFTTISFIGENKSLKEYFLKLASTLIDDLGNIPTYEAVRKEIANFIELFKLTSQPQLKTIQGLWAELFLISESKSPKNLLSCWHTNPNEKFDFNNGKERIEVKSTLNEQRVHNFSIEQLNSPKNTSTVIVSVIVKKSSNGKSISSLQKEIRNRIIDEMDLVEKLKLQIALTLGKSINEALKYKFDFHYAKDSIRFYNAKDIPQVLVSNIPPYVYDVRFSSDLSNIKTIEIKDYKGSTSLFNSIL
jgi:hypothetical protein